MKRVNVFAALSGLDDRYIAEAQRYAPADADSAPERIVHMNKKRVVTFLIAAVLMLTLSVSAFAAHASISSPKAAEKVALEQIEVWKEMGILSENVHFDGEASDIYEIEEHDGGKAWFGRLFPHSYRVSFYGPNSSRDDPQKYGCCLWVDTMTGKITAANIDATADDNAVPVREEEIEIPVDPADPGKGMEKSTWYFYENYDDLFPADMTVDRFCHDAIDGSTLLKDINGDTSENYYLTVFFDGDQKGAPMYIQLHQFPGYVTLTLGETGHAVG